jgi:hydrogenase expression/formation protein HypE
MIMKHTHIHIDHGSGGDLTDELISDIFLKEFSTSSNRPKSDSALLNKTSKQVAFTTDSYVIQPIFFPGGDIGKLSVCGTVNDLAVSGAEPKYLSVSYIIEEGFPLDELTQIVKSQAKTAVEAGVEIVCGDTKVVEKGSCDRIFINTSGIGFLDEKHSLISSAGELKSGDVLIASGTVGEHGSAVLCARERLTIHADIISDCAPLNRMIQSLLSEIESIKFMRDATRGGLATVLCELAELSNLGIEIEEEVIPVKESVNALCDMLGLDPLYMANEGRVVIALSENDAENALRILHTTEYGKSAAVIGTVTDAHKTKAVLKTSIGGKRILNKLSGSQLPRIC